MKVTKNVDVEVTVDVDVEDFTTAELSTELAARGIEDCAVKLTEVERLLDECLPWLRARPDVPPQMRELVWDVIGKVL